MSKMVKLLVACVLVVAVMNLLGCAQVPAGHMGVITKWSKVDSTVGEGLHWYEPVSKSVIPINCQVQKWQQECKAASHDLQTVSTVVALNYYLDPTKIGDFYSKYGYVEVVYHEQKTWVYVVKLIVPRIDEVVKKVTANFKAPELITQRGDVKSAIEAELRSGLEPFGIIVDVGGVSLTDFSFSEVYDHAIEEKQVAEQERDRAQYELERTEIEADTKIAEARGQAEAASLMTRSLSPMVLQRDWIEKWNGELPRIVSDDAVVYMPRDMGGASQ